MGTRNSLLTALVLSILFHSPVKPSDWPQWRGPGRDGITSSLTGTERWSESPARIWRRQIGTGHSSPIVLGDRIFTHSRRGEDEVVSCLDLATGSVIWQQDYPAPYEMNSAATSHGKGPKSTPITHRGKLVTLGISGILSCFDTAGGQLAWRHDFSGVFKETSPLYGTAMSPLLAGDRVITHVGGHDHGSLRAYSLQEGGLIWSWDGDGPGYASPILANLEGTDQIVTQSQEKIIAVSLADGSELWQMPFSTPYIQNIVTPIASGKLLIFSGLQNGTFAVQPALKQNRWSVEEIWRSTGVSSYMSTPVLSGNSLFGFSHHKSGQLFCLDSRDGQVLWTGPGREGESAALILSGSLLFVLKTDADFLVYENSGKALRLVGRHSLAESPTWAHPVILGPKVLIKDASNLTLWEFPAQ